MALDKDQLGQLILDAIDAEVVRVQGLEPPRPPTRLEVMTAIADGIVQHVQPEIGGAHTAASSALPPGLAAVGATNRAIVALPRYDSDERGPYVRIAGNPEGSGTPTVQVRWTELLPLPWSAWSTTFARMGVRCSDPGGTTVTLTVRDTAGSAVLTAAALTKSTSLAWTTVPASALGAGTWTADGLVTWDVDVTLGVGETVDLFGGRYYWVG